MKNSYSLFTVNIATKEVETHSIDNNTSKDKLQLIYGDPNGFYTSRKKAKEFLTRNN